MEIKPVLYSVALLIGLSLMISSCKKEKTDSTPQNQVSYYGVSYPMNQAVALHQNKKTIGHQIIQSFFSPDAVIHETGNVFDSVTGMGQVLKIYLFSTDSGSVSPANYIYDTSTNFYRGTFNHVYFAPNYNFTADTGSNIVVYGGMVFVKKTGTKYNISYNGADKMGRLVSFYYDGVIKDYFK